ncbi:TPA: hypothetical protein I7726_06645 [Vibrio vulnificus]|nr:hypothetical protein [Vibrio vulnificus]
MFINNKYKRHCLLFVFAKFDISMPHTIGDSQKAKILRAIRRILFSQKHFKSGMSRRNYEN